MKTYIRRNEKNDKLVILFAGWGCDENLFLPMLNEDIDFILFSITQLTKLLFSSNEIIQKSVLIGWSSVSGLLNIFYLRRKLTQTYGLQLTGLLFLLTTGMEYL